MDGFQRRKLRAMNIWHSEGMKWGIVWNNLWKSMIDMWVQFRHRYSEELSKSSRFQKSGAVIVATEDEAGPYRVHDAGEPVTRNCCGYYYHWVGTCLRLWACLHRSTSFIRRLISWCSCFLERKEQKCETSLQQQPKRLPGESGGKAKGK